MQRTLGQIFGFPCDRKTVSAAVYVLISQAAPESCEHIFASGQSVEQESKSSKLGCFNPIKTGNPR